jgi:hypothetical protein
MTARAQRNWKGALLLGTVGGVVLGTYFAVSFEFETISAEVNLLIGFAVAVFCCCGPCGLFCLPANKEVDNPTVRGLLEGMVVVGWVVGAVAVLIFAVYEAGGTGPDAVKTTASLPLLVFFIPSPIYFTILCWNNLDWHVMTLLAAQFQFRVVGGLSLWIMVMDAWRLVDRGMPVPVAICWSLLLW